MGPIVHIGYHKTATSWFQRCVYPFVGTHRLVDRRFVRRTFMGGDAFDFDPEAARVALGLDQQSKPPIICEEDLSGVLHNGVASGYLAREVARRLHATLPQAQVVIFVRAQPSAAVSWYQQYVREGGTFSIHRYLFPELYRHLGHVRPLMVPHFSFSQLDYQGLVRTYDELFGREQVIVLPFEQLAQDRALLLQRMGALLDASLPNRKAGRINVGYRRGLIPIARAANLFTGRSVVDKLTLIHIPYWYTVRKALLEKLNRLPLFGSSPEPEMMLDRATLDWMAQRFCQSNRWMEERMGIDLRALGYPLDPPPRKVERPGRLLPLTWMRN